MMTKVAGQPVQPLPANAARATKVARVWGSFGPGFPDLGVCEISGDALREHGHTGLHLMIASEDFTRESVERFPGFRFVWTGIVNPSGGERRDNFKRLL